MQKINARGLWTRVAAIAAGFVCLSATAAEFGERRVTFGGFGTVGAIYHNTEGLEYRRSVGQPDGAQAGELDFGTDSLAGLQVNAAWNRELEAVVQMVSKHNADADWRPRLTRGFIRYVPNEAIMLRAGRIGSEFFPRADSSDIGYSYLTIRPPTEMFGQLPHDDFDGVDLTLSRSLGPGLGHFKVYGGRAGGRLAEPDGSTVELSGSKMWGGYFEYLQGGWAARLGIGWFLVGHPPSLDPLIGGLQQTGQPRAQALADEFARKGRRYAFITGGLTYDEGPLQARLFLVRIDSESVIGPKTLIGTTTVGYSFGAFTPYTALSRGYNYADQQFTGLPNTPQTAPLNSGAYAAQVANQTNQSSVALGLRYDVAPKMDIKFQVDHLWVNNSEMVFDRNTPPRDRAQMTVFGLAFDFIF